MDASYLATAVKYRPLWELMIRFNCRLAADLHPAHAAEQLAEDLWQRLRSSPAAARQLTAWITRRYELDPRGHWDFSEPRHRLALLPGEPLGRLTRQLGVVALHRLIARVVLGAEARRLRQALGDEDYQFALKRARFLAREQTPLLEPPALAEDVPRQALELGCRILRACLLGAPPAVLQRVHLKLPPEADVRRAAPLPAEAIPGAYLLAKRLVAFEVAPELAPCLN